MKKILITILGATVALGSYAQIPGYVPTNGLSAWYSFSGNANDDVSGNNGTINGATLTAGKLGLPSTAYSFNGVNNTIDFNNPFLNGTQNTVFSFHVLLKLNSTSSSPNIWGKTYSWGEVNFAISSDNEIVFGFANSVTGNKYSTIISNTNVIQNNTWYDIVIVYQNSIGQIYLNSLPINTNLSWTAQGGSILSTTQIEAQCNFAQNSNSSKIGLRYTGGAPGNYFDGIIDEFGIWNRALTQQEITLLYNTCSLSVLPNLPNQTAALNDYIQFVATAQEPNATYQWQSDIGLGFQNLSNAGQYSGATNDTLTIASITTTNNNQTFRCIITSGGCSDTTNAALLSVCQTSLTTQPQNQDVDLGSSATFSVAGSNIQNYQWQSNLGFGFQNLSNAGQYSGVNTNTLMVSNTTSTNNNQSFRCVISSNDCSDTSAVAILTIKNNVGINEDLLRLFSIYPNPANSQINVQAHKKTLGSVYTLYNNIGKTVLSGKINSENTIIELGNLSDGIYLLSVGENLKQTFKVIKQ